MKKFVHNTIIYFAFYLLIIFIAIVMSSELVRSRGFQNHETEVNLFTIKEKVNYDIIIIGISHGRVFSRDKNHGRVEKILNKSLINLAQGGGRCGLNELYFYQKYFYDNKNTAKKLIYFVSPTLLFSNTLPKASNTFSYEPFNLDFFFSYLFFESENKYQRLFYYLNFKLNNNWLQYYPSTLERNNKIISKLDTSSVREYFYKIYGDTLDMVQFSKSCQILEKNILSAKKQNTQVIFIIPPALFGKWPGNTETANFAKKMQKKYDIKFYDYSQSILEPKYYYDHHHLNTDGVVFFTEKYIKEIL